MTPSEILALSAMSPANPSYPRGPYRFVNREYLIITYETDPEAIRAIVPEPLEPDGSGHVHYEWIAMPDSPGYVWTPLVEKQIPDTAKARGMTEKQVIRDVLLAAQPTKKFATVDEMAALAGFLTTDGAASITGTALPVDGGWTAH